MKKRILALFIVSVFVVTSITACGSDNSGTSSSGSSATTEVSAEKDEEKVEDNINTEKNTEEPRKILPR